MLDPAPFCGLFLFGGCMKEYTSQELKDLIQINSDKKKNILMGWIDHDVLLKFTLVGEGEPYLEGKLRFFTRYDYVVQFTNQDTISILAKHAVLWIDRV